VFEDTYSRRRRGGGAGGGEKEKLDLISDGEEGRVERV
jgi:hypothetical protein